MGKIRDLEPVLTYQGRKDGSVVSAVRVRKNNWRVIAAWLRDELRDIPDSSILAVNPKRQEVLCKIAGNHLEVRPDYTIILDEEDHPVDCLSNSTVYRRYRPHAALSTTSLKEPPSGGVEEMQEYSRWVLEGAEAIQHQGDNLSQIVAWATDRVQNWSGIRVQGEVITLDTATGPRKLEYGDYLVLSSRGAWSILSEEDMASTYTVGHQSELNDHVGASFDVLLNLQRKIESQWGRLPDSENPENVSQYIREVALCLEDELHEALAHVHWKPWKTSRGFKDREKYRVELADVLHFVLDLYLAAGLTGSDIYADYLAKHQENLKRRNSLEYVQS